MCSTVSYQYSCGHQIITVYECVKCPPTRESRRPCRRNSDLTTSLDEACHDCITRPKTPLSQPQTSLQPSATGRSPSLVTPGSQNTNDEAPSPTSSVSTRASSTGTVIFNAASDTDNESVSTSPLSISIFAVEALTEEEIYYVDADDLWTVWRGDEALDVVPLRTDRLGNAVEMPLPSFLARQVEVFARYQRPVVARPG